MFSNNAGRTAPFHKDYKDARAYVPFGQAHDITRLSSCINALARWPNRIYSQWYTAGAGSSKILLGTQSLDAWSSPYAACLLKQSRGNLELLCDLRHIIDQVIYIDCSRCGAATRSANATWTERCWVFHFWRISIYLNGDLNLISVCMGNLWLKDAEDVPHCPNNCNLYLPAHR